MKKIFSIFTLLTLLFATSCTKDSKQYSGPALKHFPATSGTYFVEEGSTENYLLPVGTIISTSGDQTMNISIDVENSTALEGTHFDFAVQNPVLKSGDVITNVELLGKYETLDTPQTLKLMVDGEGNMQKDFLLTIQKFCPYIQDEFVGDAVFLDAWWNGGPVGVTIVAGESEDQIIVKGMYDNDVVITLNSSDKANFTASFSKVETGYVHSAYGMMSAAGAGTFSSCDGVITLGIEYTVDAGSFGTYPATITY